MTPWSCQLISVTTAVVMPGLTDYDTDGLASRFAAWGFKPAHARRLLRSFYLNAGAVDLSLLQLGKSLRARIESEVPLRQSQLIRRTEAADGTAKLLIGFDGGGAAESVLMPAYDPARAAGCVSSQIGCAMGCDFCASTRRGLERNLEAGEIVEQFLHLKQAAIAQHRRLSTLVFMGMGEPMHNLDNVLAAVRRIAAPGMGELGWKQITISTVGVVPGIERLAEADLNVHLALSLHAPDDATRSRLVPANRRYRVAEIMDAAQRFQQRTGRIVTIEYCMLTDVNDSDRQASQLADLLQGFRAHVNLIPYNPIGSGISGVVYRRPSPERVTRFLRILQDRNVVAHCRRTRGDDVDAACGQLREMTALAGAD
jgi:23S rRNA (adenine2503-C2)-methyltransferase